MAAILDGGRLRLSGYVGDYYFEDGFTSAEVVMLLAEVGEDDSLDVHVNSGGGVATEGAAIHALLAARPGRTNIVVEGIAASAASLIAMAGDTITMAAGSVMMIHDPASVTWGTAADHAKTVEQLEALATSYARVYAARSGKSLDEARAVMQRETWFTPEQAVSEGFADTTTTAQAEPVAAFDYRVFSRAPKALAALARKQNWTFEGETPKAKDRAARPAIPRQIKEPSMTEKPNGGVDTAELERLRSENAELKTTAADRERRDAVLALPEAKGREALAQVLADTGLTPEKAKAALLVAGTMPAEDENPDLPDPQAYERGRVTAAGLTGKPPAGKGDITVLAAAVARTNKRR